LLNKLNVNTQQENARKEKSPTLLINFHTITEKVQPKAHIKLSNTVTTDQAIQPETSPAKKDPLGLWSRLPLSGNQWVIGAIRFVYVCGKFFLGRGVRM